MRGVAVNWGIISTARINRLFLGGARQSAQVRMLGVASRSQEAADRYARENEIERAYGSYEALLADPEIEAVYVSLPNALHVDWSVRALEAGKHVLCEKPLSRHPSGVERAFAAADQHGRLLMEAFMFRHNPQTARVRQMVAEGAVGRLRLIRAAFSFATDDPANVRLLAGLEGGGLMDVGCYCISAIRLLAGEPERVYAEQALGGDGVDVALAATLRLPADVLAHFDCGLALAPRDQLEVVGDAGSLYLSDPWHCRAPRIEWQHDGELDVVEPAPVNSYMLEAENFSAAIRGEAEPLLGRADALGQARVIEALYRAAATGETVAFG
ncbi:MAG: Gfo/Idh/MocA family protein [Solirubrobacteraceae bacterium]